MGLCLEPDVEDACHVDLYEDESNDPGHSRSIRKAAKMAKVFVEEKVSPLRLVETTSKARSESYCCRRTWKARDLQRCTCTHPSMEANRTRWKAVAVQPEVVAQLNLVAEALDKLAKDHEQLREKKKAKSKEKR